MGSGRIRCLITRREKTFCESFRIGTLAKTVNQANENLTDVAALFMQLNF